MEKPTTERYDLQRESASDPASTAPDSDAQEPAQHDPKGTPVITKVEVDLMGMTFRQAPSSAKVLAS